VSRVGGQAAELLGLQQQHQQRWHSFNTEQHRWHSIKPEHTVYSGPTAPSPKRITLRTLREKYQRDEPISMVTAYDYPSAVHVSWILWCVGEEGWGWKSSCLPCFFNCILQAQATNGMLQNLHKSCCWPGTPHPQTHNSADPSAPVPPAKVHQAAVSSCPGSSWHSNSASCFLLPCFPGK
jgi:hypothetical protein